MAAASMGETGTEFGECAEPCEHTDCTSIRRMKASPCTYCSEPIGTRRFYRHGEGWDELDHEACAYDAARA